jgi:hypothetical protein
LKIGEEIEKQRGKEIWMETCEMMNSLEKETGDANQCEKMIGEKRERNRDRERYVERERER